MGIIWHEGCKVGIIGGWMNVCVRQYHWSVCLFKWLTTEHLVINGLIVCQIAYRSSQDYKNHQVKCFNSLFLVEGINNVNYCYTLIYISTFITVTCLHWVELNTDWYLEASCNMTFLCCCAVKHQSVNQSISLRWYDHTHAKPGERWVYQWVCTTLCKNNESQLWRTGIDAL